ncbi:MAG: Holliday junction branch migration protein RuvA [candidate division Zixibacteria bacterium]|nr:Holliday junction branch migration protein RuvA [candidate division Zixibacteria bacterium]NIS44645.1 Holliday junction branch migration protein RuvA [candidate division Zixibacteria bacterium]NIU12702.1 Holliday junction branch migration protein RuvA [candidate division Zixibacteria bacterium]NIV04807.1 Holliday junction branch migration protein RuvA [candidate division Zixibacteria bacterium]NIW43488.1 Holliday junction branch migration protein RuvA [Gammaproteobacteria bacterium]
MIATIRGEVTARKPDRITVELSSGLGYVVYIPTPSIDKIQVGKPVFLHTYLVVRENELTLYGFESVDEREYFVLLVGVNGVGPKLALSILSTLDTTMIYQAVASDQPEVFSRVPGIGKKTAQKMMFHLKDKLEVDEALIEFARLPQSDSEVLEALMTLGYSVIEAQAAIQSIPDETPDRVEDRLARALQYFSS